MTRAGVPDGGQGISGIIAAIVMLGVAIVCHFLGLDVVGLVLVVGALVLLVRSAHGKATDLSSWPREKLARWALTFQVALGGVATLRELWVRGPGVLVLAGVATVALWGAGRRLLEDGESFSGGARWALLGAATVLVGCWLTVPARIDVFVFQDVAAERLRDGINPYLYGYPNYYSDVETARIYGPGLSVNGELQAGFPYPPMSLLLSTGGWLLGDPRLAHGLAVLGTAWLMMAMVPHAWTSRAAAVLFISTPMLMHVIRQSWTEPFLVALLVLTLWLMRRGRTGSAVALGLFLAVKQYAVIFLPVVLGLAPAFRGGRRLRAAWVAIATAGAVTLPLALWHPPEFLFSVGLWQFQQPFRADAMSLPSVLAGVLGVPPPWLQLAMVVTATATAIWWSLRRLARDWPSVAVGVAVVMLAFLLLNKQAFTNYYLVALSAMCLALSLSPASSGGGPHRGSQTLEGARAQTDGVS